MPEVKPPKIEPRIIHGTTPDNWHYDNFTMDDLYGFKPKTSHANFYFNNLEKPLTLCQKLKNLLWKRNH